jgi:hypothetical protein
MFNPQSAPAGQSDGSYSTDKMNPELLQKFMEAACQGQFGPQAKQMAEAAKGQGSAPPASDGSPQQQPAQDQQTTQPPQPGRTLASRHIFGRPVSSAPSAQDGDEDDDQQQAPMGARGIFGR